MPPPQIRLHGVVLVRKKLRDNFTFTLQILQPLKMLLNVVKSIYVNTTV